MHRNMLRFAFATTFALGLACDKTGETTKTEDTKTTETKTDGKTETKTVTDDKTETKEDKKKDGGW